MSAERKKKTEPQAPDAIEPKETAPVEEDSVKRLIKQLEEMMEGFQKDFPISDKKLIKNHKKLRGMSMKTTGFIVEAFNLAKTFPYFAPHYLDVTLLDGKLRRMESLESLNELLEAFSIVVETVCRFYSDDCYKNAMIFYESLKEAVKRKQTEAEVPLKELQPFFKNYGRKPAPSKTS
jgi:hypothetical protein